MQLSVLDTCPTEMYLSGSRSIRMISAAFISSNVAFGCVTDFDTFSITAMFAVFVVLILSVSGCFFAVAPICHVHYLF